MTAWRNKNSRSKLCHTSPRCDISRLSSNDAPRTYNTTRLTFHIRITPLSSLACPMPRVSNPTPKTPRGKLNNNSRVSLSLSLPLNNNNDPRFFEKKEEPLLYYRSATTTAHHSYITSSTCAFHTRLTGSSRIAPRRGAKKPRELAYGQKAKLNQARFA